MDNCKFYANLTQTGGALEVEVDGELNNCLFFENDMESGGSNGGATRFLADFKVVNCTFSDNAAASGGAILYSTGSFTRLVHNSILAFNGTGSTHESEIFPNFVSNSVTLTYSCVQHGTTSNGNITGNPDFLNHTASNLEQRNYQLDESSSPCIDAGDETLIGFDLFDVDDDGRTDQGQDAERIPDLIFNLRVAYADIDMGAYEVFDPSTCPADLASPVQVVDVFDLFELLSNWNTSGNGAALAAPTNVVDVFDLFVLLADWGPCGRSYDVELSDDDCYKEFGTEWSLDLEDCLEAVAIAEGYLEE